MGVLFCGLLSSQIKRKIFWAFYISMELKGKESLRKRAKEYSLAIFFGCGFER